MMFINSKKSYKNNEEQLRALMNDDLPFEVREAVNQMCINVMCMRSEHEHKSFVITSAGIREGKTVLALGMARSLARIKDNAKVLFVDADLRASDITRIMVERGNTVNGLSEYLSGAVEKIDVIKTDLGNLDIVCAGAKILNPIALFTSKKMREFFADFTKAYDYVIIDTSPVGIVPDALVFADFASGYIISTRSDRSKITAVNEAIESIRGVNGKVLGTVLTSLNVKKPMFKKDKEEERELKRIFSAE